MRVHHFTGGCCVFTVPRLCEPAFMIVGCLQKGNTVASQLPSAVARQQEEARYVLLKTVGSITYLALQGLALRGHVEGKVNLSQDISGQDQESA